MKKDLGFVITLGIILALIIPIFILGKGTGDFIAYWSAAHLFVSGGNPYNQAEMSSLQHQTNPERFTDESGIINAWNPPWLILILLPIGILPISFAVPAWVFCNTLIIGLSIIITWKLCMGEQRSRGIIYAFLTGFLFVETISYLIMGQVTSIVLLGIILSIWFIEHDMDFPAGIALFMTTIKPHIAYLFFVLVFVWIIQKHRWKVIIALILSAVISMSIFWIIIPNWLIDYIELIRNLPINIFYTSTLGSFLAYQTNLPIFRYLAVLLIFLIKPLLRIQTKEGWLTATNLALLLSVPLSPYGFNFDHIVLLPSLVQVIAWSSRHWLPRKTIVSIAVMLLVINIILAKLISISSLEYYWFFWVPLALLGIYLLAWKISHIPQRINVAIK